MCNCCDNEPWECPRCHHIKAPWVDECSCESVDAARAAPQPPYWPNYPYTWPWVQPQYPNYPITWTTTTAVGDPTWAMYRGATS